MKPAALDVDLKWRRCFNLCWGGDGKYTVDLSKLPDSVLSSWEGWHKQAVKESNDEYEKIKAQGTGR